MQSIPSVKTIEQEIDDLKTQNKKEAMKASKKDYTNQEQENKIKARQIKTLQPGKCMPQSIQKLKKLNKVAIVGFAPSWNETPWDDPTMDIWGINELYLQIKKSYGRMRRVTGWFEIHDVEKSPSRRIPSHHKWLKEANIPIFMHKKYDWIPNSVAIPIELLIQYTNQNFIINDTGSAFTDFSNQISLMILTAIMMGYEEIHVYGVDMAQSSEYQFQKPSVQYFIGLAAGLGIKFLLPKTCELCKFNRIYGGWGTDAHQPRNLKKSRIKTMKQQIAAITQQIMVEEFERNKQKAAFTKDIESINETMQRLDDELLKMELIKQKDTEVLSFLNTMPKSIEEIEGKKDKIYLNVNTELATMKKTKMNLEKEKKKLESKKKELEMVDYVNERSYLNSKKSLEGSLYMHQGIMGECKHDLSHNLV